MAHVLLVRVKWIENDAKMGSQYLIMHATLNDGIYWHRNGKPMIASKVKDECQTSPSILKRWHLPYDISYRHGEDFRENTGKDTELDMPTRKISSTGRETTP